jgi:hypothetical protein
MLALGAVAGDQNVLIEGERLPQPQALHHGERRAGRQVEALVAP